MGAPDLLFTDVPAVRQAEAHALEIHKRWRALPEGADGWFALEREFYSAQRELQRLRHAEIAKTFPRHCPRCGGDVEQAWGQCIARCDRAPNHRNDWSD